MNLREFYKAWLVVALMFGYIVAVAIINGLMYIGISLFIISPAFLPILKPSIFSVIFGALLLAFVTFPVGIYLLEKWEGWKNEAFTQRHP